MHELDLYLAAIEHDQERTVDGVYKRGRYTRIECEGIILSVVLVTDGPDATVIAGL